MHCNCWQTPLKNRELQRVTRPTPHRELGRFANARNREEAGGGNLPSALGPSPRPRHRSPRDPCGCRRVVPGRAPAATSALSLPSRPHRPPHLPPGTPPASCPAASWRGEGGPHPPPGSAPPSAAAASHPRSAVQRCRGGRRRLSSGCGRPPATGPAVATVTSSVPPTRRRAAPAQ